MKTLPTDALRPAEAKGGRILVVFVGEGGRLGDWLLLEDGAVASRGPSDAIPVASRTMLAVPGTEVAIHWLEIEGDPAPAQAAAVARLMLADASAEPLSEMHVAAGRPERGLTPAAMVPMSRMADWIAAAQAVGIDPDFVVPVPLLLKAREDGLVRADLGPVPDYRGPAAAFSVEPELADLLSAGADVETIEPAEFEADLGITAAEPLLNLRQGPFARRRHWKVEKTRLRRMVLLATALAGVSLAVQVAALLRYTFAADRLEAEASALAAEAPAAGSDRGPGFSAIAAILFEGVRSTPNAELTRIEYRPDGTLGATVQGDAPATLAALRQRLEASGLGVEGGAVRSGGGRPTADIVLRPA